MSRISRNISVIVRTERMIARRRLTVLRNQTWLFAFAGLAAGIGLVMLNISAFYALSGGMTPYNAALIVALANLVLAGFMVIAANRMSADDELEPVTQLRDMAIDELEADLGAAADEVRDLSASLRRITRDPIGTLIPSLVGPLLSILLRSPKDK